MRSDSRTSAKRTPSLTSGVSSHSSFFLSRVSQAGPTAHARHYVELLFLLVRGLAVRLGRLVAATALGPRRELGAEERAGVRVLGASMSFYRLDAGATAESSVRHAQSTWRSAE